MNEEPHSDDELLLQLRDDCQRQYPQGEWLVENGVVWLRDRTRGQDFGFYSKIISGGVLWCIENGMTVVHRPIPAGE